MFMDLVKLSKRVAKFLNNENVSSLSDIYTHLQKDVFLKDILLSLDGLQFIKLTFLIESFIFSKTFRSPSLTLSVPLLSFYNNSISVKLSCTLLVFA